MADGTITFSTALDNSQLEADLKQAGREVEKLERKLAENEAGKTAIEAEMERAEAAIHETEAAIESLKAQMEALPSTTGSAEEYRATRDEADRIAAEVSAANEKLEAQVAEIDKLNAKWQKLDEQAAGYTEQIGRAKARQAELGEEYARSYSKGGEASSAALAQAEARFDKFGKRVNTMMKKVFVFGAILAGLRAVKSMLSDALAENERFSASWANLKAVIRGMADFAAGFLAPVLTGFVNMVAAMLTTLARLVDSIFKTNIQGAIAHAREAAQAANDQAKATKKLSKAAKEAGRQLMAFDEINAMSADTSNDAADALDQDAAAPAPDWNALDVGKIDEKLAEIMLIVGAALLAVGAILAFSGINIPLGLTLMAIGALMMYTAYQEQWDKLPQQVRDAINAALVIAGIVLLVIGAVLAFSGVNIPLGIGMMLAGAALLYTAAALNWKDLPGEVKAAITAVMVVLGAALLVIGAILSLSGANIPLGVGLIAAGAISLAAAAALNWGELSGEVKGVVLAIAAIVSAALLVIGGVLAFSGANVPLGIGLMAAGALGLAASVALAWNELPDEVRDTVSTILLVVGGALLVLGAVLAFSGVNIPLGIALLLAGTASLAAAAALKWNSMSDSIRGIVSTILGIVGGALIVIGIILCVTGVGIPMGIACILAGVASLVGAVAVNWDFLKQKVSEIWKGIVSWWNQNVAPIFTWQWWRDRFKSMVNGLISCVNSGLRAFGGFVNSISKGLGGLLKSVGVSGFSFEVRMPQIPYLAQGAVIPPNREFLAVLGDQPSGNNIEAPESLVRRIVREESGGADAEAVALLRELLDAVREGKNIYMDDTLMGRAVQGQLATMARMSGA